jgi:hypothetical protein
MNLVWPSRLSYRNMEGHSLNETIFVPYLHMASKENETTKCTYILSTICVDHMNPSIIDPSALWM